MSGRRNLANRVARSVINVLLMEMEPGTEILTEDISRELNGANANRDMSLRRVGQLLKEREDLERVADHRWVVR